MKKDIILAGVGGQGILSISYIIDNAALEEGLNFKQSEVHGMSQRGGSVQSHLRISDQEISSDLVSVGSADLLIGVEPMETERYIHYLSKSGSIVTGIAPVENIPNYPNLDELLQRLKSISSCHLVDSETLAKEAGNARAQNMVIVGAASKFLPMKKDSYIKFIEMLFARKGEKIVDLNKRAFELGQGAVS
ncbi:MAG: indolepyruvate oxidoreductase subunit beta [Pseudomonadota bacterium]